MVMVPMIRRRKGRTTMGFRRRRRRR